MTKVRDDSLAQVLALHQPGRVNAVSQHSCRSLRSAVRYVSAGSLPASVIRPHLPSPLVVKLRTVAAGQQDRRHRSSASRGLRRRPRTRLRTAHPRGCTGVCTKRAFATTPAHLTRGAEPDPLNKRARKANTGFEPCAAVRGRCHGASRVCDRRRGGRAATERRNASVPTGQDPASTVTMAGARAGATWPFGTCRVRPDASGAEGVLAGADQRGLAPKGAWEVELA